MSKMKNIYKLMIINVNILFKIDIYFSEYSLAVEIDKKNDDRDLISEVKRQKALEKKPNYKFVRINTNNGLDYELEL